MSYFNDIINYFSKDPLRILTLIGGAGGLVYWYDRYKNRSRLKIRLLNLGLFPKSGENKSFIKFEAENLGTIPISLEPSVLIKGFIPVVVQKYVRRKFSKKYFSYKIESNERNLPPRSPKMFEASDKADEMRPFLWFATYIFTPTRGKPYKIRIRSAGGYRLSLFRYIYELISYFLFNKLTFEE